MSPEQSIPAEQPTQTTGSPPSAGERSFAALGVDPVLVDALAANGITSPFPVQQLTVPDALAGRDVCGKAKTGSGKTLAFGLPLVQRLARATDGHPRGMVLVPTRELALQVAEELRPLAGARDLRTVAVYGGAPMGRQLDDLERGADILVATPGRLIDCIERAAVSIERLEIVVVDEADRMADLGFLPQVEWILRHTERGHQTLLFSATLDGVVQTLVDRYQVDPVTHEVAATGVTVDEMRHLFLRVHEMDKTRVVAAIGHGARRTLVFVPTKRGADRLVIALRKEDVDAEAIHGDRRQQDRERALARFSSGRLPVLVATDVAARGIHVDDVDVVVHYEPDDDHKSYLHRSGRTARAGDTGVAVTLVMWNQELQARRLQRRLGLDEPIIEVFSNDPRLADLAAWEVREPA